jgi:ribosomal protein RSM22 (predicted rRNA methylase)
MASLAEALRIEPLRNPSLEGFRSFFEIRDGRLHVSDALAAKAYLAARLPATYAAIRRSLADAAELSGNDAPKSMLDIGSGPGTALWAVLAEWPALAAATLVEASDAMRVAGTLLAQDIGPTRLSWRGMTVESGLPGVEGADLVTLC